MIRRNTRLVVIGLMVGLSAACSKAEEPEAAKAAPASSEAANTAANGPTSTTASFTLSDADKALIATLSPQELAMARLSCVEPVNSAKGSTNLFDAELAAQLKATPYMERTALIVSIEGMTIPKAREIMDASVKFAPGGPAPTDDQITGLKQCILLANHYAAEQAAAG